MSDQTARRPELAQTQQTDHADLAARGKAIAELIPPLRSYAMAITRNSPEADDLVQEVLERILASKHSPSGPDMVRWCRVVMRNVYVDRMRDQTRRLAVPIEATLAFPGEQDGQKPGPIDLLTTESVLTAVNQLDPHFRRVFYLHYIEGLTFSAIAELLGVPVGTVGTRLWRARARLRSLLERQTAQSATEEKRGTRP